MIRIGLIEIFAEGTKLELTLEIPKSLDKSELGRRIIRGLSHAITGRVRVIESAEDLDEWIEGLGDNI